MTIHEKQTKLEFAFSLQTKETLLRALYPMAFDFMRKYDILCRHEGVSDAVLRKLLKKNPSKEDIVQISCVPFLTKNLFSAFRDELPSPIRRLMDELIWVDSLHESTIKSLLDIEVTSTVKTAWSYERTELKPMFHFFSFSHGYASWSQKSNVTLFLPTALRNVISEYYDRPLYYHFIAVEESERRAEYWYVEGEKHIFNELTRLMSYVVKDNLKFNARSVPTVPSANRMGKSLDLKEFFPVEHVFLQHVRAFLLAQLLARPKVKQISKDLLQFLRLVLEQYQSNFATFLMLPHIKIYNHYGGASICEENYVNLFKSLPVGEWVSFENVLGYARYRAFNVKPTEGISYSNLQYVSSDDSSEKEAVTEANYYSVITIPCMQHACFLMASFGILDIGYDLPSAGALTVYEGLKYVRLTALGAYLFGVESSYSPPEYYRAKPPVLSSDSLVMVVDEQDETAEINFEEFMQKMGKCRYRVVPNHFIHNCKNSRELSQKIIRFKELLSDTVIPDNWESFFSDILQKSSAFRSVEPSTLFQIPPSDSHLIQLVVHDVQLKNLVVKAENFVLVVSNKNLTKFKNRMRDLGYLVE